jgi:hypothetical protein
MNSEDLRGLQGPAEVDLDFPGTLALAKDPPVGFKAVPFSVSPRA